MAAMQDELGPDCVTGVVSVTVTDGNSDVQFEAFQVPLPSPSFSLGVEICVVAQPRPLHLTRFAIIHMP